MKILHTADWHLGATLEAEKRFDEHDKFLQHLCSVIKEENIKAVIIAGDVFDTHLPPNRAAEQYYRFLVEAGKAGAENIIVTGGNHDSAAYLEAPKEILKFLSVHVFASASQNCEEMIVELKNEDGSTAALVGAVPYLHERDLVTVEGGQGVSERETTLRNAMLSYFKRMADTLVQKNPSVPHILTGHLFATDKGSKADTWTGTLMSVNADEFPETIDYLALGHLHDAQTVKTSNKCCIRYSGAPLNISFRELEVPKSLTVLDTDDIRNYREIPLPAFQDMRDISGTPEELQKKLTQLAAESTHSVWCKVVNTGEYTPGLTEAMHMLVKDSHVRIIKCRNQETNPVVLDRLPRERHLADLAPADVFKLLLNEMQISGENADVLLAAFNEIETAVKEEEE